MRIKPAVGSVMGPVDDTHWGQVMLTPHAYGIVEVFDVTGQARQYGVNVLSTLTHKLTDQVVSLKQLEEIADTLSIELVHSLGLLVAVGNVCYIVFRGQGRVYLKRDDKLATLVSSSGAISGELRKGDTLLLVSKGFTDSISHEELTSVFDHLAPQEVAEKLTLLLHKKTEGPGAAALVFQVTELLPVEESTEAATLDSELTDPSRKKTFRQVFLEKFDRGAHRIKHMLPLRVRAVLRKTREPSRRNKMLGIAAVGIVGLFLVSVLLGIRKQSQNAADQSVQTAVAQARFAFEEGTALMELNAIKGRERLGHAKQLLEPYLEKVSQKSPAGRDLYGLYNEITNNLTQAMKIYRVTPELFYDVALLKKGAVSSVVSISEATIGILDRQTATVYAVSLGTKSGQMLASGGDLQGAMYIAVHGNTLYIESEKGIVAVSSTDKKPVVVVAKPDVWKVPSAIVSFGGNLYVLDTGASRIWKYSALSSPEATGIQKFSDTREYLNPDTLPDFSRSTSLSIDGSVWIASSDGNILKFTQGRPDTFQLRGVEPELGAPLRLFTSDTTNNLYILDMTGKRVVVVDKEGIYIAQYVWETSLGIADFAVTEAHKMILLVSEGKIYSIGLQ